MTKSLVFWTHIWPRRYRLFHDSVILLNASDSSDSSNSNHAKMILAIEIGMECYRDVIREQWEKICDCNYLAKEILFHENEKF